MSIGQTKLDILLKKGKLLKELDIWYKSFDTKTKETIIDLIQNKQLKDKGVDGLNQVVGYYSYATELITKGRKQQGEHYTLEDTGYFFNTMRVEVTDALLYVSGDGKKGKENLYKKYGDYITTLNDDSLNVVKEIIKDKYVQYIRKILQID
jgi:hypothetical protein